MSTSIITTIAGTGTSSYSGDTGPATAATLNSPHDVTLDTSGNVFIMDRGNSVIRKITTSTGVISTYIGGGGSDDDGGAATAADVDDPCYGRVDSSSNFYFSEYAGGKIRKVTLITDTPTAIPRYSFNILL